MKNEILEFLNRHNGGKTAEIAEALAVTDYQARYYLLLLEKAGMVQRSPLRRGMATYWFLKGEKQGGKAVLPQLNNSICGHASLKQIKVTSECRFNFAAFITK